MDRKKMDKKRIDAKKIALAAALCALIALLYFGAFGWLLNAWLTNPYYSHGILILPIVAFLVWRIFKMNPDVGMDRGGTGGAGDSNAGAAAGGNKGDNEKYRIPGFVLIADAAAMYLVGFLFQFPFAAALSFVPLIAGLGLVFLPHGKKTLFPAHFFLIAIPIPWIAEMGILLQKISVYGSFALARLFWSGAALEYPAIVVNGQRFNVELACSGLNGAISLFALALIVAYFVRGRFWKKAVICALSIPYAVLANIARISITVGVGVWISPQAAVGFFHYASDLVLFLIALLLLIASCKVMKCLNFEKIMP